MDFNKRKDATMAAMNSLLSSSSRDKSPKGSLDTAIIHLLYTINSHPSYFTTSSCSGRISLFAHPVTPSNSKKKSKGGSWLFITHDIAEPSAVIDILFPPNDTPTLPYHTHLVFRFEPLIIAAECKDLASAQILVSIAIASGFRESGITSASQKRVIVGIRCSLRLEVPLGDSERLLVSPDYLRFLVGIANEKMEVNRKRTYVLLKALWNNGFNGRKDESEEDVKSEECAEEEAADEKNVECEEEEEEKNAECEDDKNPECEIEEEEDEKNEECEKENETNSEGGKEENERNRDCEKEENDKIAKCEKEVCHLIEGCSTSDTYRKDHTLVGSHVFFIIPIPVSGHPIDKLLLWGHSSVLLSFPSGPKVFIFGGFGGAGTHSRKNESFLFDPTSGTLETVETTDSPSPRLGHTSSQVGNSVFVVGGRAGISNIMNDVWVFRPTTVGGWRQVECGGCFFNPRHRHSAAAVGSKIYVFGGVADGTVSSLFHALDTDSSSWEEVGAEGEGPAPRHSHSMVAYGHLLFLFGGYDGSIPLGDLHIFDTKKSRWKAEQHMAGKPPRPSFSHTMFIYKRYVGILGGCPITPRRELSFLDLTRLLWRHFDLDPVSPHLFVRTTAEVVGHELVLVGGGSSCFAFGSHFTRPVKVDLLPLEGKTVQMMVRVGRKYAKLVKDELKKSGWLDPGRKPRLQDRGEHLCLPIRDKFPGQMGNEGEESDGRDRFGTLPIGRRLRVVDLLIQYGATVIPDDAVEIRRSPRSPAAVMAEALTSLTRQKEVPLRVLRDIPTRWEKLGDMVVLPVSAFRDPAWDAAGHDLWQIVAKSLNACRLARQGCVAANDTRDSMLEILVGDDGWVDHCENGISFTFDATKCMFSRGNLSERIRVANMDCRDEVVVDLFAGIGYFVLPFLVGAKAKHVYACEWNPHAVEALRRNLRLNSVEGRCVVLEGDNRLFAPKRVADRVCLGLLPTSEGSWATAVRALRPEGGVLHVHGNVKDVDEACWMEAVSRRIRSISVGEGYNWGVRVHHLERVKWYAPHVRHVVADVGCRVA